MKSPTICIKNSRFGGLVTYPGHQKIHLHFKVDTHDKEPNSAQEVANKLLADVRLELDGMPRKISEGPADPFDLEYTEFGVRQLERLMVEVGRERRLYRRYLGEARAQRRKALRAWCAFNQAANLNSRNELSGAGGVDR